MGINDLETNWGKGGSKFTTEVARASGCLISLWALALFYASHHSHISCGQGLCKKVMQASFHINPVFEL